MSDQQLPHDLQAERALLGSILIDPDMFWAVSHIVSQNDFYHGVNGAIFAGIADLGHNNTPIDFITLGEHLRAKKNPIPDIDSILIGLLDEVPTSINAEHYGRIVADMATRRRLIRSAGEFAGAAYDLSIPVDEAVSKAETAVSNVTDKISGNEIEPAKEGMRRLLDEITDRVNSGGIVTGLSTGFHDLDKLIRLQRDQLVLLAGRPGMGKSVAENEIALSVAKNGGRVFRVNLEMGRDETYTRGIATLSRVPFNDIKNGNLDGDNYGRVMESMGHFSGYPMWVDDTPTITPSQLESRARYLYNRFGLDLITIDYVQLLTPNRTYGTRNDDIGSISRALKNLAKSLHIPILCLAQLSRAVENRQDKRPVLSDLRDSGSLEQDADAVIFIYRDDYYNPDDSERPNITELNIAKHRHGPTGTIDLYWHSKLPALRNLQTERIAL